jgi:hypothetical protein
MIYEVRTYMLKPGTVVECEKRFAEALPYREKVSPLGAFWHTELGPLNQIIHVWPYENLKQRTDLRAQAVKDPHWPPKIMDLIETMESEIFIPAPFMQPLGKRQLGQVYEMRTYLYQPGTMPEVLARWAEAIPQRVQLSPLAACWYSEVGELNTFVHIWPYQDLEQRDRIRAEAMKLPQWPPKTREFLVKQTTKILIPASFSPMQ